MDNYELEDSSLDSFYVYRSLHSDESWGAILSQCNTFKLPNISFGMKVYARNEREAIIRARDLYERNYNPTGIQKVALAFASESIAPIIAKSMRETNFNPTIMKDAAKLIMRFSHAMEQEYRNHLKELHDED